MSHRRGPALLCLLLATVLTLSAAAVSSRGEPRPAVPHSLEEETVQAVEGGAQILMVDTGSLRDLERCQKQLDRMQARSRVQLAFAGGVRISEIPRMACLGMDILCIGKEIVDARLLDMRQDVV